MCGCFPPHPRASSTPPSIGSYRQFFPLRNISPPLAIRSCMSPFRCLLSVTRVIGRKADKTSPRGCTAECGPGSSNLTAPLFPGKRALSKHDTGNTRISKALVPESVTHSSCSYQQAGARHALRPAAIKIHALHTSHHSSISPLTCFWSAASPDVLNSPEFCSDRSSLPISLTIYFL